jgi:NAD(P)-dependent dehydrogenase (short-subunit alcohol dehydrogenase family)
MSGLLEGRRALVTGGGRGLGAAIVARLAAEGAVGLIADLPVSLPAEPLPGWSTAPVDVRDERSVEAAFDAAADAGPLHLVVACAGVVPEWQTTAQLDIDRWDDVFAINARGVALTLRETARRIAAGGSVVVVASLNGWRGDPNIASYVASKHAAVGLTRAVALDLGRRGVRVNALAPGPIATEALQDRMRARAARGGPPPADALAAAAEQTALGRIATTEDVANAALFLASDLSAGVTGHLLPVDGGLA